GRPGAAGGEGQGLAPAGESNEALDVVIAVGTAAEHAQRQIDLGGRFFGVRGRRHLSQPPPAFLCSASAAEAVSSGSPDFSLASILTRSSGSGLRSRASHPSKPASTRRPTPPYASPTS